MKLTAFRVMGFMGFADSGDVELSPKVNLIVGQNNSGKSALVAALANPLEDRRHRNPTRYRPEELPPPSISVTMTILRDELERAALRAGSVRIPVSRPTMDQMEIGRQLFAMDEVEMSLVRRPGQAFTRTPTEVVPGMRGGDYAVVARNVDGRLDINSMHHGNESPNDTLGAVADQLWSSNFFIFGPQRFNIGKSPFIREEILHPSAQNLPNVLNTLQGDRTDVFEALVQHLREIFDHVGHLSVASAPDGVLVRVWPTRERSIPELSFPLSESGTGVSQVIAMLVVMMTYDPSVIVIDEIASFLHPLASKALLRLITTKYDQHQYIITTHAPETIAASAPELMYLVRRDGYDSRLERINLKDVDDMRSVAGNLGISMSDVFAADSVVWVEGQTEEALFPLIAGPDAVGVGGVKFVSVITTGELLSKRRDRHLIYEIYQRLSSAAAPLVTRALFALDREGLTKKDEAELRRDSQDRIHFLPRRNIESFFLHSPSISALLADYDIYVPSAAVRDWLDAHAGDERYLAAAEWAGGAWSAEWLERVDGAALLSDGVVELSGARLEYSKVRHGTRLLAGVLASAPATLDDLKAYVFTLVAAAKG